MEAGLVLVPGRVVSGRAEALARYRSRHRRAEKSLLRAAAAAAVGVAVLTFAGGLAARLTLASSTLAVVAAGAGALVAVPLLVGAAVATRRGARWHLVHVEALRPVAAPGGGARGGQLPRPAVPHPAVPHPAVPRPAVPRPGEPLLLLQGRVVHVDPRQRLAAGDRTVSTELPARVLVGVEPGETVLLARRRRGRWAAVLPPTSRGGQAGIDPRGAGGTGGPGGAGSGEGAGVAGGGGAHSPT